MKDFSPKVVYIVIEEGIDAALKISDKTCLMMIEEGIDTTLKISAKNCLHRD
jgi:hypothetical protein